MSSTIKIGSKRKELNSYLAFPVQTVVQGNKTGLVDEGRISANKFLLVGK